MSVQCIVLLHTEYYTERSSILTVMRGIRGNKQSQELCISRGGLLSVRYERETECMYKYEL